MCVTKWMTCRKSAQNMIGFPLCGKLSRSDSTLVWICHVVDWRGEVCERPLRPRYNDTRDRAQLVVYEWVRESQGQKKESAERRAGRCSRPGHRPPPHPFSHTQTACTCVCVYIEREKRTNQRTHKYVVRRGSYNCKRSRSHSHSYSHSYSHSQQQDEQYR